ncbi:MAG: transcriptional regulator [Promethearchaeota archaeon]
MENTDRIPPNNEIFPTSVRFPIMLILYAHKNVGFTELQKLLHLTPGNLDFHIKRLEGVNYVKTRKSILTGRPLKIVEITKQGELAFKDYINNLRHILKQISK